MSIKIYRGYDASFTVPSATLPTSIVFAYASTGSNATITGSFTQVGTTTYVTLGSSYTATLVAGSAQLYVVTSNIPTLIDTVTIADITTITETHAQKCLSAIEATLEGRATSEVSELQIGGRMIKYIPLSDLLKLKAYYTKAVADELKQIKIQSGLGSGNKINIRFR